MRVAALLLLTLVTARADAAAEQTFTGWSTVETEHVRLHVPPDTSVEPQAFAKRLQEAFDELQRFFAVTLPGRIEFYAWNEGADVRRILGRPVGFAEPEQLLIHAAVNQTRGHELAHVLAYHAAKPAQTSRFLEEGTAVAFDLSGRDRVAAAQAADAFGFISNLPQTWEAPVARRGYNFSGGQRQRLAISRTLTAQPRILILDDSTSALDVATESRVQAAIPNFTNNVTTIYIAQRISAVIDLDLIVLMENGAIVATGTHEELLASNTLYQEIYASQLGGAAAAGEEVQP